MIPLMSYFVAVRDLMYVAILAQENNQDHKSYHGSVSRCRLACHLP